MRLLCPLLAGTLLALLTHCSSDPTHRSTRSAHQPQVFTGVTEYYHHGSKPSLPPPAAPPSVAAAKLHGWARIPGPRSDSPVYAKAPVITHVSSTHGPTFANPDGTTSRVIGNALVRSDGTRATMIGNTAYHSNGTTSRIVGDTLINADGSQSSRINDDP